MAVRIESHAEPIPGYRLIERIGGGGFGEVWKAEAPGGLFKAIKFVFGDLASAGDNGQRAEQELKALSRVKTVRHPYILSLERYDIIEGQLIIVMELADRNLWDRFKECRAQGLPGIPRDELLGYMEESAEALDLMNHEFQLQHLDIKPQNIFLVHQHIKVADFGLVKDLEGMQASVTGGVTPVYAAPETFDGWVSRYSDQYSLAIVYQELLTGQRPFNGNNVRQLILQHLQTQPNVSPLPSGEQAVIARALAKKPDDRHANCRDLVKALRTAKDGPAGRARPADPNGFSGEFNSLGLPALGMQTGPLDQDDTGPNSTNSAPTASFRGRPEPNPGVTQSVRALDGPTLSATVRKAPPEAHGDGSLFPALVVGLGQLGLSVLQSVREHLTASVGSTMLLPQLRLLLLDTDPEVVRAATRGRPGAALAAADVVLAPLNRPSYYLKHRDGRPPLSAWLNPRMLYRIPRSQVTTGVRALGRLAFCDNYRMLAARLRRELEAALEPAALTGAAKQTGLGLRTNRPRVYVVTSLAGGTGSGMFLDLAYTVRALLKQLGYDQPDVVGLLLLPPVDGNRTRTLTLGNAYAALTELRHYARPDSHFKARYHEREAPINDAAPPFGRCVLLPLPDETDEVATREQIELAGRYLFHDLVTPLGRAADLARAGLPSPPWESRGLFYNTFGLFPLAWPRHALLAAVSRRLCRQLVQRWLSKDSKPVREAVQEWVQERWAQQELSAECFIDRLQVEAVRAQRKAAETVWCEALKPLADRCQAAGRPAAAQFSPEEVAQALAEMEALVGRPNDEPHVEAPGTLTTQLREAAEKLTKEWAQKLAEMPVRLIEEPRFRLAGAEESVRQVVASIEQTLQHHEPLSQDLLKRAQEAHARLLALSGLLAGNRKAMPPGAEVVELLRTYAKARYQSLVMQRVTAAFVSLRGHLSDELREINFCRVRLTELLRVLDEAPEDAPAGGPTPARLGREVFTAGCTALAEAVEHFLQGVGPDSLLELDVRVEAMLRQQFTALVHVCLTHANILKGVEQAMLKTASDFAGEQLPPTTVAELFLEQHPDEEQAAGEVAGFYDEAAPELAPRKAAQAPELSVLAAPPGEGGERLRELARRALPEVDWQPAASADDAVIYRELSHLALADLEHLGAEGRDAYRQMNAADHFTPHSRIDVDFSTK
ncbi:MAG TPA: tubulin-like doman-containing protein [Gemmataceae bacterium]|jgi:serine/threonine protein kinase|nr:tubulin-like doman-containing protein [Gemmataceae bacterium]